MGRLSALIAAVFAALLFACAAAPVWDGKPTNDLPNPYRTVAPWGKLPASHREWGALNGVAVDRDGRSLWVVDRCGKNPDAPQGVNPFLFDTCAGSSWAPVHKLDADGNIVKSFGAGLFVFPHKIYQDREGNVWVVDMRRHTAIKFDAEGKVLMTIGRPGVAGDPRDGALTEPCSIVEAPNGDLFIAEGHSGNPKAPPGTVARISRFAKDGKFIRSFGKLGSGPGEFMTPHDIAMDDQGRLLVADRGNHRIQILGQDGSYISEFRQFGRPSGVALRDGLIYVADSESNGVAPNPGWLRGIRVGELSTGKVLYRIPDPLELKGTSAAEGVAVDAMGNVYGGEVGPRQLVKHMKERSIDVMNFREPLALDHLPDGWRHRTFFRTEPMQISFVTKDGRPSIRLATHHSASMLYRFTEIPIDQYPLLAWDWFVEQPVESDVDETTNAGDDHPARLYLKFRNALGEDRAMEIIWGNRKLRAGDWKYLESFWSRSRFPHYVARGGDENAGRWFDEKLDLRTLYREQWGDPHGAILREVALFCDTDQTGAASVAYFSRVRVERAP